MWSNPREEEGVSLPEGEASEAIVASHSPATHARTKAAGAASDAPSGRIADLQAAVDSHPPAGAAGTEQEVEVVGDEAAGAIDALILLASISSEQNSIPAKRRRRVRAPSTRGAPPPADARDTNDGGDHSCGDCSPAARHEKASPEASGPASSPEPLPGMRGRPPQPGGAAEKHHTPKLAPLLPLPPLSELHLPSASSHRGSSLNNLLVRRLSSPPGTPTTVAARGEHFSDACSAHDAGVTTRGSGPLIHGFVATRGGEVKREALEGGGLPAAQVHTFPCTP
ncbi:hypothetical protein T484DRAFT_1867129 [Baffinella frigidus]|nr:hypothetical protein T484DRAFT_1867129 [Cryptophyta sp. CCMP2293]